MLSIDNDEDGVPNALDVSPNSTTRLGPFDDQTPLKLEIEQLQRDVPVLVDVQIRPTDPEQLYYGEAVLDWPTGDRQGQIQRRFDTNFGDAMQISDPSHPLYSGDMRLVPMLEVRMPGDSKTFRGPWRKLALNSRMPANTSAA